MHTQESTTTQRKERLIRCPEVQSKVGFGRAKIYDLMNRTPPAFPQHIKLSSRCVCWKESAIDAWIQECIKAGAQA
jgi:prophage regulatory protein